MQKLLIITKLKKRQKELFENSLLKNNKQQLTRLNDHRPPQQQTLKPSSTVTGFKKLMYNFVKLSQNQLQPSYNRRKYNHSHYNQTLKERTRLNRIYAYLSKPTIKSYCAFTIKPTPNTYSLQNMAGGKPNILICRIIMGPKRSLKITPESLENKTLLLHNAGLNAHSLLNNYSKARPTNPQMTYHRPIPKIVNFLESRLDIILWKNQFANSIKSARQTLRQGILVNGGLQKKSSFQTLPGDVFTFIK